jgi:hypothetical protein
MDESQPETHLNAFAMRSLFNPWTNELKELSTAMAKEAEKIRAETKALGKDIHPLLPPADEAVICALDGGYGSGKTVLVHQWYHALNNEDPNSAVFMNAWTSDHSDNPMMDILTSLLPQLYPNYELMKEIATNVWDLIKKVTDVVNPILTVVTNVIEAGVDAHKIEEAKKTPLEKIHDKLATLASQRDKDKPLFIFIDELDRAKPTYALALLESVKHLFNIPNVIFVLVMNKDHLAQTVCSSYGYREVSDGHRYLERFCHVRYSVTRERVLALMIDTRNDTIFGSSLSKDLLTDSKLNLREIGKVSQQYSTIYPKNSDYANSGELFALCLLITKQTDSPTIDTLRQNHPNFAPSENEENKACNPDLSETMREDKFLNDETITLLVKNFKNADKWGEKIQSYRVELDQNHNGNIDIICHLISRIVYDQ